MNQGFERSTRRPREADAKRGTYFRFHPVPKRLRNSVYIITSARTDSDTICYKEVGPKRAPSRRISRADWFTCAWPMKSAEESQTQAENLAGRIEGNREQRAWRREADKATGAKTKAERRSGRRRQAEEWEEAERKANPLVFIRRKIDKLFSNYLEKRVDYVVEVTGEPRWLIEALFPLDPTVSPGFTEEVRETLAAIDAEHDEARARLEAEYEAERAKLPPPEPHSFDSILVELEKVKPSLRRGSDASKGPWEEGKERPLPYPGQEEPEDEPESDCWQDELGDHGDEEDG